MTPQHSSSTPLRWLAAECRSLPRRAFTRATLPWWSILLALAAGTALRIFFVLVYPAVNGDSTVYGSIAKNLLVHHLYALGTPPSPTLIRLPGYPFFLALIFKLFGLMNYNPSRYIQLVIDLISCLLIFGFVHDHASRRAAHSALWFAALCPFTANYVATPMTETFSIFCVALGLFAAGRLIRELCAQERMPWSYLLLIATALSCAILFRPDGGLLAVVILPSIWWYTHRNPSGVGNRSWLTSLRAPLLCALLVALPFVPWTIRNYRVFHIIQPLAPRFATDPGDSTHPGYMRWTRTWLVEYVSTPDIFWKGDDEPLDIHLLPSRAFDSPQQYRQTEQIFSDYNNNCIITPASGDQPEQARCKIIPEFDARFAALAEQRIRSAPIRFYVTLPLARVADMWLRPRTEQVEYPSAFEQYISEVPARWWEWREHPEGSAVAFGFGLLNAALLLLAIIGFARRRVPLAGMLSAYLLVRSLLLATLENAEPRYTLEAFPILIIAATMALTPRPATFLKPL